MTETLYIKTYGCQMNEYDSQQMRNIFESYNDNEKCHFSHDLAEASIIILNTCHIREKAAEKVYSELGRIRLVQQVRIAAGKSKAVIIVAGCVGQAEGEEIFARSPIVDIVVGPQSYYNLPKMVKKIRTGNKHLIDLDFVEEAKFDNLPQNYNSFEPSSFVSIQGGCDKFCSFCVVPYTRGAEFSRPMEQIYREVLKVVSQGAKEVILLGQNVSAYHGKDHNGGEYSLAALIRHIAQIKGLERIRYTTSHPRDMTDELLQLHATEAKLMPFLHLPVQSGSNKILKLMNRRHNREAYLEIIKKLRQFRPDIVISSDIIVGFPGEEEEDFSDTLNLIREVGFGQCYYFKYSPRPGTPAANKEQIPEHVKAARLNILQEEVIKSQLECNKSFVGKIVPVLFDRKGKYDGQIMGKTPYMQSVHVISQKNNALYGNIVNVKILDALPSSLSGEIVA